MKRILNALNVLVVLVTLSCVILSGWTNPLIKNMTAFWLVAGILVVDVCWLLIKDLMRG